jgi:hypothetical protein
MHSAVLLASLADVFMAAPVTTARQIARCIIIVIVIISDIITIVRGSCPWLVLANNLTLASIGHAIRSSDLEASELVCVCRCERATVSERAECSSSGGLPKVVGHNNSRNLRVAFTLRVNCPAVAIIKRYLSCSRVGCSLLSQDAQTPLQLR